ncbi:Protein HUA2-LIKE 3 [Ananas comosus]|uniref:Protein HUA2-LIKE 3 n=1 Tax=Ananas comosus TaxID=4615 RepID=A0A199UHI9_ANACO|nr:Protein HUA2-LIKE 3 [Ananas comosus]
MAPARRKGSGRAAAAAAAAAAQQWKVGDLVLAKMKGFPAWPAVVRHPSSLTISSSSYAFKLGFSCSMPEPLDKLAILQSQSKRTLLLAPCASVHFMHRN